MVFTIAGCDLIDGTQVRNPDLTLDEAVGQPQSAQSWLKGLERRTSILYAGWDVSFFLIAAELSTDNYENKATFFNQNVDNGVFRHIDNDFDQVQFNIHRLREQAKFGIETVIPENDPQYAGTSVEAEMYFYKGWSHLLAGETFVALPAEPDGPAVSPQEHYNRAIAAFEQANTISANISYDMALARVYYAMGEKGDAVQYATSALSQSDDYLRVAEYDGINGPLNAMQLAVYERQSFNDLQPLPRLDFLDPKYGGLPGTQQSPVIMQSSEEMHLILAEAAHSDNDLGAFQGHLHDLLALIDEREVGSFNETEEGRIGTIGDFQRPDSSAYVVRADESSPFVAGLVLDRTAATMVPRVSGTSVTAGQIDALTATDVDALELLYLMRQEVFFGEGRRMFDLGIRWPVSETEELNNPNITDSDIQAHVPAYMPSPFNEINAFEVDRDNFEVTIAVNMNRVLAENRGNIFD
jgi:tetratricopeptide (TPR) repeat protein